MTNKKTTIKPLRDRVVVKILSKEEGFEKTASGIVLPESTGKKKNDRGEVVAVGEGRIDEQGKRIPVNIEVGQTVVFSEFSAEKIHVDGEDYHIISEDHILAVLE